VTDRAAVAHPHRALAGSVAGKSIEALTLAALAALLPRAGTFTALRRRP